MADSNEDWNPRQGWASNFRKYRWFNLVMPILTPMGLISIFLFGFVALGVVAFIVALFCWFDLAKSAKVPARKKAWQAFSIALVPVGIYLILMQFIPALQG
jgi:hypothetical protein